MNDNKQEGSSFLGTYENPFFNISSALSTYQEQSYKENMIIILNSSEFTVSSYFKIEMPLVIKSINFIDDSLKGFMVFTSNGRFEISSSLELNNLVIQIRNPSEMENLFSLEIGASLNLQVSKY